MTTLTLATLSGGTKEAPGKVGFVIEQLHYQQAQSCRLLLLLLLFNVLMTALLLLIIGCNILIFEAFWLIKRREQF